MDKEAIKAILPHREPMLLIDEVDLVDDMAVARYTVRGDEFFLQGHFPGNPVVPGVILCEMMAQSCCLLINEDTTAAAFIPYYTGIKQAKFKDKVLPGDTVVFKSELTGKKGPFYFVKSSGYVRDRLCVQGELSFAVLPAE